MNAQEYQQFNNTFVLGVENKASGRVKKKLSRDRRAVTAALRFPLSCSPPAGGLDEALYTIINTCRQQEVPFVFALNRKTLGRCVNKVVPVSLVGIFNYDGAQVSRRQRVIHHVNQSLSGYFPTYLDWE